MLKYYSLEGVCTYDINILPDDRGFFAEGIRSDWVDIINEVIVQTNISYSYPGMVRAWHRHIRGQIDMFLVLRGTLKICAYDENSKKMNEVVTSQDKLQIVKIPGHYFHGTKNIGNESSLVIYFVNRLYDYNNPDEERRPWNDKKIIPLEINGNSKDPRVNLPWDWFYPPHK